MKKMRILGAAVLTLLGSATVVAKGEKTFMFSLPLASVGGEAVLKGEYNMPNIGGLGFELVLIPENEAFSPREVENRNGDSLMVRGSELAMYYSSYGDPKKMAGGYWSIGAGYRQMAADWQRSAIEESKILHRLRGNGTTFRGRVGYRFVGDMLPFTFGAYVGVRHFANRFADDSSEPSDENVGPASQTPKSEVIALEKRFTSSLEPGLEFGMAF